VGAVERSTVRGMATSDLGSVLSARSCRTVGALRAVVADPTRQREVG